MCHIRTWSPSIQFVQYIHFVNGDFTTSAKNGKGVFILKYFVSLSCFCFCPCRSISHILFIIYNFVLNWWVLFCLSWLSYSCSVPSILACFRKCVIPSLRHSWPSANFGYPVLGPLVSLLPSIFIIIWYSSLWTLSVPGDDGQESTYRPSQK